MAMLIPEDGSTPRFIVPAAGGVFTRGELGAMVGGPIVVLEQEEWRRAVLDVVIVVEATGAGAANAYATWQARLIGAIPETDVILGPAVICRRPEVAAVVDG